MAKEDPSWFKKDGNGPYHWGNGPKPKKKGILSILFGSKKKGK